MTSRQDISLNFIETFVISSVTAVAARTLITPVDRCKILITHQTQFLKDGLISRPYKGFTDCMIQTYKYRGIRPLYQGNLAICIRYFPIHALNFAFKNEIKRMFKQNSNDSYSKIFFENFVSGGIAGALSVCILYSLNNARQHVNKDIRTGKIRREKRQLHSIMNAYKNILVTDGIAGLYRGFLIVCVHDAIYRGCYFGFYDTLKPILLGQNPSFFLSFILGYGVTLVSHLVSYPVDTVRRRMWMDKIRSSRQYTSHVNCLFQIIRNEHISSLFRGANTWIIRSIPGAGLLAGFDLFAKIYLSIKDSRS
ncbi:unnamed protein product [Adineta ricciae]|uniref:ADP/ATP translocase n=1 Tax=Adineta ricciae TaxID=249248 RepID=A0A816E3I1_ADIRI|nr:unnamed protein product [Adineta ricciae]CAF1642548.1 unnamed protein product [Adineta ricciae]